MGLMKTLRNLFLSALFLSVLTLPAAAQSGFLQYGATVSGDVSAAVPSRLVHFSGQAGDAISITARGDGLLRVTLLSPSLTQIAVSSAGSQAQISQTLPETGVYHLLVAGVGGASGEFTLLLESAGPASMVLLQPEDGAVLPVTSSLTFAWEPVPGTAAYLIEREACNAAYTDCAPMVPVTTNQTSATVEHDDTRPARWRVRPVFVDGTQGPFSEWSAFSFGSPTATPQPETSALVGTAWQLTSLTAGQPALADVVARLEFREEGAAVGNSGCNGFSTTYTISGQTISFGAIAASRVFCGPEIATQETAYFAALQGASSFVLSGDQLFISYAGQFMTFARLDASQVFPTLPPQIMITFAPTATPTTEAIPTLPPQIAITLAPTAAVYEPPMLLEPAEGSEVYTYEVVLDWEIIMRGYDIELTLCPVNGGACTQQTEFTNFPPLTVQIPAGNLVTWRVSANTSDGPTGFSAPGTFLRVIHPPPTLLEPAEGSEVYTYEVVLDWEIIMRGYDIELTLCPVNGGACTQQTEFTNFPPLTVQIPAGNLVTWRVSANTSDGPTGFSAPGTFLRVIHPPPTLLEPAEGSEVYTYEVVLDWEIIMRGYDIELTLCPVNGGACTQQTEFTNFPPLTVQIPAGNLVTWRVSANTPDGPTGFSAPGMFTHVAEPAATRDPSTIVDTPIPGRVTSTPTTGAIATLPPMIAITLAPTATFTPTATNTPIAMERVTNTPTFTPTSGITDGDLLLQLGLGVSTLSFELAWPPDPVNYVNIRAVLSDAAVAEPGITYELRLECALAAGDNVQWSVFGAPGPSPRSCGDVIPLAFGPNRSYWEMQVLLDRLEGPVTKTLRLVAAPVDAVAPMLPPLDLTLSYDRPASASGMASFPQGMRDTEVNLFLPSRDPLPAPALFEVTVTCAGRIEPLRWNILNTIDIHQPPGFDSGPHMCGVMVPFAYSQPETVPYISVWYDWPAAQSSANFTVTVRHVRPAPSATPSPTPEPERPSETPPSETARPTDIPIAAPDRDFAIRVNAAEGARFSDDISHPDGDTSDLISVTLDPLPQRGETFMQFTLECTGVGVEAVRWQVRGISSELSCGALARVPFSSSASQQTVVVTLERSAQQSYVAYTLSITPP